MSGRLGGERRLGADGGPGRRWAQGNDERGFFFADAVERAKIALSAFEVEGVATTIPFHLRLLDHADFGRSRVHTRWVESGALNTGEQP